MPAEPERVTPFTHQKTPPLNGSWPLLMIGFGPVSRPPPRRAAVMRAGANGPVGGGSTSENHRMPDVWPHRNRLLSRPFPLAGSSSKVAKSPDNVRSYRLDTEESINRHKCLI